MPPTILNKALAFIRLQFSQTSDKIVAAIKDQKVEVDTSSFSKPVRELSSMVRQLESAIAKFKEPTFSGEVSVDASELKAVANDLRQGLKNLKPDMSGVERGIRMMLTKLDDLDPKATVKALEEIRDAFLSKEMKWPERFKLDEEQLRSIRSSGGGALMLGGGEVGAATRVTMNNTAITLADTEYSYTFPANTVRWTMKLRDQGTILLYAFAAGKLPTSGDGSAYATVPQNFYQSEPGVEWSGKTIYLQSSSASQVAEIVSYQR